MKIPRFFVSSLLTLNQPLLWCELLWWCPSHTFFFLFLMFFYFMFCSLSLSLPPSFFLFFIVFFFYIFIQYASRRFPGSFSLIISPNSGFSFCYVSSSYGIISEKAFPSTCMHFYTKVGEKITGGWCLHSRIRFTRAHT